MESASTFSNLDNHPVRMEEQVLVPEKTHGRVQQQTVTVSAACSQMVQDPLDGEGLGDPDTEQEVATWPAGDSGPRVFRGTSC